MTIGLILGITLCAVFADVPNYLLWGGLACLLAPIARPAWIKGLWRLGWMLCFGLAYAGWHAEQRQRERLPEGLSGQSVPLVVRVRDLPVAGVRSTRVLVDVESRSAKGFLLPKRLQLYLPPKSAWPPASRWQIVARLKPYRATANAYGFNAEQWLWAQGLLVSGAIQGPAKRLSDAYDVMAVVDKVRALISVRIKQVLGNTRESALIEALTIGAQHNIVPADWRLFSRTGVTHLVSISGVHVGMLACMVTLLVRRLLLVVMLKGIRAPKIWVAGAGLSTAGLYSLLAGWAVPTRRTFFMLAVAYGLLFWRRALSPFQIFWLSLAIILLLDPFAIYFPGLWLSFGMVAALMLSALGRRRPPGKVALILLAQWTVTVVSCAPLAGFFSTLPLVSPLANFVAIPLISLLVVPLALLGILEPSGVLLSAARYLTGVFYWLMESMDRLPPWTLPALPWYWLLAGLMGSLWLILPRGVPGRSLGAALLIPLFTYAPARPAPGQFHATVFDVGQGLAILIKTAKHNLLYDTGALAADRVLLPQLSGQGVKQLDYLVLSHHDSDHDAGGRAVVQALAVDKLLVGQRESATLAGMQATLCQAGQRWHWDGVEFAMLAPPAGLQTQTRNAHSCVLHIRNQSGSLLIPGDIPESIELWLMQRYGRTLSSSVLIAPHHGSKTSSSLSFLKQVKPRWAIISAGYANRYRHPHSAVLQNYKTVKSQVWRTDYHGALELYFAETLAIHSYRQNHRYHWQSTTALVVE